MLLLAPVSASAGGGLFGSNAPNTAGVEQSADEVIIALDDGTVEIHLRVGYRGGPEAFAWVIPVAGPAELLPGSSRLFDNLRRATLPRFELEADVLSCADPPTVTTDPSEGPTASIEPRTINNFGPDFFLPGEYEALLEWLEQRGLAAGEEELALLQEIGTQGNHFVALFFERASETSEIYPIALRYPGEQLRLPLRIGALNRADDAPTTVYVLSDRRVAPTNVRHVRLNQLQIDRYSRGGNYLSVVAEAVDSSSAQGSAFVTEFAGSTDRVSRAGLYDPSWDAEPLLDIQWFEAVTALAAQGLVECSPGACTYRHPAARGLLLDHVPVPPSVEEDDFYRCPLCFQELFIPTQFSAIQFAIAFDLRVVFAGFDALTLLDSHPYVTRMTSVMSAEEPDRDPVLGDIGELEDVGTGEPASYSARCNGDAVITFADGRELFVEAGGGWPEFGDDMPFAEFVERGTEDGFATIKNRSGKVDRLLAEHNAALGWPPEGCGCGAGPIAPPALWWLFAACPLLRRRRRM